MIDNIKDLERVLKLCRKQGVVEINLGMISFKLGELPAKEVQIQEEENQDKYLDFPDGPLTPEELAFFANGGLPEDNPYRNAQ